MGQPGRPKGKETKILNLRVEPETVEMLTNFCEETGVPKTVAVNKILNAFLTDFFSKPEDERTIFKM